VDAARRAFLLGRRSPSAAPSVRPTGPQTAWMGEDCLARQGVICRSCGDHCEAGAITFAPRPGAVALPVILFERCTGCGECAADCPTQAIAMRDANRFPTRI
jgi:ferredoxin-type protein NapF